jgi:hypothetical protein
MRAIEPRHIDVVRVIEMTQPLAERALTASVPSGSRLRLSSADWERIPALHQYGPCYIRPTFGRYIQGSRPFASTKADFPLWAPSPAAVGR